MTYYEANLLLNDGYSIRRDSWENINYFIYRIGNIDISSNGDKYCENEDNMKTDWVIYKKLSAREIKKAKCKYLINKAILIYSGSFFISLLKILCITLRSK